MTREITHTDSSDDLLTQSEDCAVAFRKARKLANCWRGVVS